MKAPRRLGQCPARHWPALLAALELEFVFSRGRRGPLAERYPAIFDQHVPAGLRVCLAGDEIVSACMLRRFHWQAEIPFEGVMIGFVWTAPARRGEGHAAFLLRTVVDELAESEVDFAVLWSGLKGFYERLGWQPGDAGLHAVITGEPNATRLAPASLVVSQLDPLRRASGLPCLPRAPKDWQCRPVPAEKVGAFQNDTAYVLCGDDGDVRFIYEAHGDPVGVSMLWPQVTAGVSRINVNDHQGGMLSTWLQEQQLATFQPQRLAFWQRVSARARGADWHQWHVPWFDRI